MNKKKLLMFGLPLLALVLVSAVLVNYLSNTVKADIEVKSPMIVGISEGKDSWATTQCWRSDQEIMVDCFPQGIDEEGNLILDWLESDWEITETPLQLPVMYTGQEKTFTLYTMSTNVADVQVYGHEEIRVANPDGVTCGDFESITSRFDSIYGDHGYGRLHTDIPGGNCHNVAGSDGKQIEIWSIDDSSDWGPGETDVAQWTITFNNVFGKYTFTYRVIPIA